MGVSQDVREALISKGASLVGFADLSEIPYENRQGYDYGVSIAVALDIEIVSGIQNGPTKEYYGEYRRVNDLLDSLAQYAAELLVQSGFKAYPMTLESVVEDEKTWRTVLPHKTVATRAGIGWIGKSAMLVTEAFGSAVRITSVLTNADLEAGTPINESRCGNCAVCKEVCPGNAVVGTNWAADIDRDTFYNAFSCRKTARERTAKIGIEASMCGLCMYSCPYTQRYLRM